MKNLKEQLDGILVDIKEGREFDPNAFHLSSVDSSEETISNSIQSLLKTISSKHFQQLELLESQTQEKNLRAEAVLDTMLDALVVISSKGIIHSCNKATEKIFGYEEDELVGKNVKILMPEPFHSEHDGYLKNYVNTGNRKVIGKGREVMAKRKDGSTFPAHLCVGEVNLGTERLFTGILRDQTEQKKYQEEVQNRNAELEEINWVKTQITYITEIAGSCEDLNDMAKNVLSHFGKKFEVGHGAFYIRESDERGNLTDAFKLRGTYALSERKHLNQLIKFEEGIVGQCAYEKSQILLTNVPGDYIKISSSLGEACPQNLLTQPIIAEKEVLGVIELASFNPFSDKFRKLLTQISESLGLAISRAASTERTEKLLEESQQLTEKLKEQQAELEQSNEELIQKTQSLEKSEQVLKQQQEELKVSNEELEEKSERLEEERKKTEETIIEIEETKNQVEIKARELEQSSKYKSEFLANMSHELRTPLNSLLLLSDQLKLNDEGNLTDEQVKMLECIHSGGEDLLHLINDILDLSKVEAGMMEISYQEIDLKALLISVCQKIRPQAEKKNISIELDSQDYTLRTDPFRLGQILQNLLSNAIKFTEQGSVSLHTKCVNSILEVAVTDTGIGIPQDKLDSIFDAFKQVDGSTSRKYGGTGLGLSITRQLVNLLGGKVTVTSEVGKGSVFTVSLPVQNIPSKNNKNLAKNGTAHQTPTESTNDNSSSNVVNTFGKALEMIDGAQKKAMQKILVVEDDPASLQSVKDAINSDGVDVKDVGSCTEAIKMLSLSPYDCIILDFQLPDMNAIEFLKKVYADSSVELPPVILNTCRDLTPDEIRVLNHYTDTIIIKGPYSGERLSKEVDAFFTAHEPSCVISIQHEERISTEDADLKGMHILIADDDLRNTLALSTVLRKYNLKITIADNGQIVFDKLKENKDISLIIMDVMMPVKDGYQTIHELRGMPEYKNLPIIALSASTMNEVKSKCIAVGANDFMTKPVNLDNLLPVLKMWLKNDSRVKRN